MRFQNMKLLGQKEEFQFFAINPTLEIFLQEGTGICLSSHATCAVAGGKSEAELVALPQTPRSDVRLECWHMDPLRWHK